MNIRNATKEDAQQIAEIVKRHFETDYMGFANFRESYIKAKMKKDVFFVTGKPINACIRIAILDTDLADIRTLCVDEEHRGKGVAQQLLGAAMEFLKSKNMRKVIARTKSDNESAIALFVKNGFAQEGYFKEHYRKDIDVVQLFKFL